ncbi:MAG: thermonuclease family protein [Bacteroidales bacterium]
MTNVVDGDTFDANVDLGFGIITQQRFRIIGIDAPEMDSTEGFITKEYLKELICDQTVTLFSKKTDSFGRYLAELYITKREEQINVGLHLIDRGLAKVYDRP